MIIIHFLISLWLFLTIVLPLQLLAWPCLAIALLTSWDGRTYFFGNEKWGRATNHYLAPTEGKWLKELIWMAWRNPVYNLQAKYFSTPMKAYKLTGDAGIGDKLRGGFYRIKMGLSWEYYLIIPYVVGDNNWRCVRARWGWKINENNGPVATLVFSINPWKEYIGEK